ncbi:MAG: hypothetical protein H5T99_00465 [Moorella sp. (in: Bacteria)]|nr:hypothetical protein [Moorella sp. (in: firmicutes)]
MWIKALYYRDAGRAWNLVRSLGPLFDTRKDILPPSQFWTEDTIPRAGYRVKLRALVLAPGKDAPYRGIDLVALGRGAARLLEKRTGLVLDWAAGIRNGRVYLLVKPMAYPVDGGRQTGFRPTPEDLEALRKLAPSQKRNPAPSPGKGKARGRGR